MKPKILVSRKISDLAEEKLQKEFEVTLNPKDEPIPESKLIKLVNNYDGMISTGFDKISENFPISKVIVFDANHEELIKRILHRGETSGRSDDTKDSIKVRLDVYQKDTEPLIEYYEKNNSTIKINAVGDVEDIYNLLSKEF